MTYRAAFILPCLLAGCGCVKPTVPPAEHSIKTATASHHQEKKTMESPKRRIPAVDPVEAGGIRYQVLRAARSRGFTQNGGIIAAIDIASGNELWTLTVYQTSHDAMEEADVQDRYITEMSLSGDQKQLLIKAENKRSYAVNLGDRSVTVLP